MAQDAPVPTSRPSAALPRGVDDHAARRVGFGLAVGKHRLDQLELGDRLAELLAFQGIAQRILEHPLGDPHADRGDVQAALVEHLHRGLEADALDPADQLAGRHPAVVEDHVTGMRALLSHLAIRLAQGQPGRTALDDESGDSAGATDRRVGARHHGVDAGLRGVGDEALGTVEHVVLAVTHRRGLQRGGVGTGVRFGEAERTEQFARRQARQVAPLLLFGAVDDDALGADAVVGAQQRTERRRGPPQPRRRCSPLPPWSPLRPP